MKDSSEKVNWEQRRSVTTPPPQQQRPSHSPKLIMLWLILTISLTYFIYTLKLVSTSTTCNNNNNNNNNNNRFSINHLSSTFNATTNTSTTTSSTELRHVVFGIAASAKLWEQRKNYIKLWYNSKKMRGVVWMDDIVKINEKEINLPAVRISTDTSNFPYTNKQGHRSAIRISRIVTETLRLGLKDVRWFVMGDDDTVFVTENLIRVLNKYDHEQFYYIGSLSESHLQNIFFSYGMAYGGGGFAISYALAKALDKMQDRCIHRYPGLYGSDDRMQACMAELGVPLTKEIGFHQYDVYGNLFGLLAAHPVTPLVSLHHLDVVEPIFPNVTTRVEALQRLTIPIKLDSAGLIQQSICYHNNNSWTISVSWGFAVQIFRGIFSPREIEMPSRTFLNWYRRADYTAYAFNTRPVTRHPCQKPFVFYFSKAKLLNSTTTVSEYERHHVPHPECRWKMPHPSALHKILVYKKPDPHLWDRAPRRNCCRVINNSNKKGTVVMIDVGICKSGEVSEP